MDIQLYRVLPTKLHTYSLYAYVAYPLLLFAHLNGYEHYMGSAEYSFIIVLGTLAINALLFLVTQWSLKLRMLFTARPVNSISNATHVFIPENADHGKGDACPVKQDKVRFTYAFN
jgi:cation-transporting ATPase 13A1